MADNDSDDFDDNSIDGVNDFNDRYLEEREINSIDGLNNCSNKYLGEGEVKSFLVNNEKSIVNLMHINCRSLAKKFTSLNIFLKPLQGSLTAIGLSETWLTPSSSDFYLEGYRFVSNSRTEKTCGGVGLFINSRISFTVRNDLLIMKEFMECVFIEIQNSVNSNIILGCVYRPPSADKLLFENEMLNILSILDKSSKFPVFIMGDWNHDLLKANTDSHISKFLNDMLSHSYFPTIHFPTRVTEHSATLLDNIFTNKINNVAKAGIVYSDISDHYPVLITVHLNVKKVSTNRIVTRRYFNDVSVNNFKSALDNTDWCSILSDVNPQADTNALFKTFMLVFNKLFNDHFPPKIVKFCRKKTPRSDWITKGLIKSCNKKSSLYKAYRKNPTTENKNKYVRYRNNLKSLLRKAENEYYKFKFKKLEGNLFQTWKLLGLILNKKQNLSQIFNTFIDNGIEINDPQDIVKSFNRFFVNIGENLAKTIQNTSVDFSFYLDCNLTSMDSFVFYPTDPHEIINIVDGLHDKVSSGVDCISVNLLKKCITSISEPLSELINSSFCTGRVPDCLKVAKVYPIYKGGGEKEFSNFRPISILPSFSKIFEKAVYNRLSKYLNTKHLLVDNQFGFRPSFSTSMAIQDMHEQISKSMDKHEISVGVFLDLSKAFDCVNHEILLRKLEHYGIRGIALNWFRDYLSNRKQLVFYNNVSSELLDISCGVPQGSILGPLLFIIYINDIVNCSKVLHFILFADDTNIFYSSSDLSGFIDTVNGELAQLAEWFRANKLSLNIKKTNYILFGNRIRVDSLSTTCITIDGVSVSRVSSTKFLGVIVDESLNWKQHVAHVSSKVSKSIGVINRVRYILSRELLLLLYQTMIYPHLLYCNVIWGNANQTTLYPLVCLQKRAVRVITCSEYRAHTSPIFARLGLLKLPDINKQQVLLFVYRFKNSQLPFYSNLIKPNKFHCPYDMRNKNEFFLENYNLEVRRKCIANYGPDLWRSLSQDIKNSSSIALFKQNLTYSLLSGY